MKEKIPVGSDHAGLELKRAMIEYLEELGYEPEDQGTFGPESVDYPDYAAKVARLVSSGQRRRGVVVCGTGIGVSISANKLPGVRAAVCTDVFMAEMAARHNNANVLALGGRILSPEAARPIVRKWLETPYEGGRHDRRLKKIEDLEKCR
jgi:ribose 5-phosphate isomerase B